MLAVFGLCCISFWIGEASARWSWKRPIGGGQQSALEFADKVRKSMVGLRDSRRFVGAGPTIQQSGIWTLSGVGNFRVTIEEIEGETLEHVSPKPPAQE
jgi:hypothetical protein